MQTRIVLATIVSFIAGLAAPGPAGASTVENPKAEIVFASGGRIMKMKADGTEREVLFGRNLSPKNVWQGASDPVVSPDGEKILFSFRRRSSGQDLTDIWQMNPDGTGALRIVQSGLGSFYGDPTFMPNGRIAYAYYKRGRKFTTTGVASMKSHETPARRVVGLRIRNRPYSMPPTVAEPDFSADGSKLLYVLSNGSGGDYDDEGFDNPLYIRNLQTSTSRKIAEGAFEAKFSPRGNRIVYSAETEDDDLELCGWDFGCRFEGNLAVINADGTGRRMLTGNQVDERSPDWSSDGRIVFQSARNLPEAGESTEIYSARPDGSCLTMLTNGSPASTTPVFSEASGEDSSPAGCGKMPPDSGVEVDIPPNVKSNRGIYWLGPRPGTRLLTGIHADRSGAFFLYQDCDLIRAAGCDRPAGLFSFDICAIRGEIAESLGGIAPVRTQRGVPVYRSSGAEIGAFTLLLAGRTATYFFGGSGRGRQLGHPEVEMLRHMGQDQPEGDLPAVKFPSFDIRLMEKAVSTYEATGSVPRTAARMGISRVRVRDNLKFSRRIKAFEGYGTVKCRA